jgi:hypothetical protein
VEKKKFDIKYIFILNGGNFDEVENEINDLNEHWLIISL